MRRPLLLVLVLLVSACARELIDQENLAQPDLSGSVRIPLATTTPDGTTYLLRGATVEISGSAMLTLALDPGAAHAPDPSQVRSSRELSQGEALSAPLPAGSYSLFLRPGFQLVELDSDGVEHAIEARLTPNPTRFRLREVEDATLKLSFERDGQTIVFGASPALRITSAR